MALTARGRTVKTTTLASLQRNGTCGQRTRGKIGKSLAEVVAGFDRDFPLEMAEARRQLRAEPLQLEVTDITHVVFQQEIDRLRTELAKANGQINRCVDQNEHLERLLRDVTPCIDPAKAGHSIALGTRGDCPCILCELNDRQRQIAALEQPTCSPSQ